MFIKYDLSYNPKIDFKLIYLNFMNQNPSMEFLSTKYARYKELYYGESEPLNQNENQFILVKEIYLYLLQSRKSIIEQIDNIYRLLKIKPHVIPKYNLKFSLSNEFSIYNIVAIYRLIVKMSLFDEYTSLISLLILDAYLSKNHYVPLVFGYHYSLYLKEMILKDVSTDFLLDLFERMNDLSIKYNIKYDTLTKEELITKLRTIEYDLRKRFGIKEVWLYGSYARDESNCYSDVDLYLKPYRKEKSEEIKEFLQKIVERRVDIAFEGDFSMDQASNFYQEKELIIYAD